MKHDGVYSRTRCGSRKQKKERTSVLSMLVTSPARLLVGQEEERWRWSRRGKGLPWMRVKEKNRALRVRDRIKREGRRFGGLGSR